MLVAMESLFDPAGRDRLLARIGSLGPDSKREWGTMDAAQALSHCAHALETATGDATLSRPLPARLLGWMFRKSMLGPKPYSKNGPTHPQLVVKEPREFEREKARLLAAVRKFHDGGPAAAARHPHALLGRMTGDDWDRCMGKHLDHHLRQFGA
jgi:hypothetical protein